MPKSVQFVVGALAVAWLAGPTNGEQLPRSHDAIRNGTDSSEEGQFLRRALGLGIGTGTECTRLYYGRRRVIQLSRITQPDSRRLRDSGPDLQRHTGACGDFTIQRQRAQRRRPFPVAFGFSPATITVQACIATITRLPIHGVCT